MATPTKAESEVWSLLTRDFRWQPPADYPVKLYRRKASTEAAKLQVFEVAVAAIFADLRPDYEWWVTPNTPDGGVDFIGRQDFIDDAALGIAAAITVGGQCKKRGRVNDIVGEVSGSLVRMAGTLNPTFFVVALSARLNPTRVERARESLEQTFQRHCHILDRAQIEGLIYDHMPTVERILREGLSEQEADRVLDYFAAYKDGRARDAISVIVPRRVPAGVPFKIALQARSSLACSPQARFWWTAPQGEQGQGPAVTLIGPVGADTLAGAQLSAKGTGADPVRADHALELITYAVGEVDLGELHVGSPGSGDAGASERFPLGAVQAIENTRPRFYERPFRGGLSSLSCEYDRALARGVAAIAVVGTGGSGKSRMCEEFSLERRRRGATVLIARQTNTRDDPHRVLADMLIGLTPDAAVQGDLAGAVIAQLARFDMRLAERATAAIRSTLGARQTQSSTDADQELLSALLVLLIARGRESPLVVHLQDLHWCTADVLVLLERLIWQFEVMFQGATHPPRASDSGVLFILEGRIHERERQPSGGVEWASEPFQALLKRLDCPTVSCRSLTPSEGSEFVRRLFEERHSARREIDTQLLELQGDLIDRIDRAAGGNPFHSLEQIRLLKERRVLGQNPATGLLYLIRPEDEPTPVPDSVLEAISLRWEYLREGNPQIARLIWATGLLEDRVPLGLFRRLWRDIAPSASLGEIDATEFLWTGEAVQSEVAFRHENYFRAVRSFEVNAKDRELAVETYCSWFASMRRLDPADRFRWARALLAHPTPDHRRARALMRAALGGARKRSDVRLARRISSALLDLAWAKETGALTVSRVFATLCSQELELIAELLASDRAQAAARLAPLADRLEYRRAPEHRSAALASSTLERLRISAEVLRSELLFNDRRPAPASEVAGQAVRAVEALRTGEPAVRQDGLDELEMQALHAQSAALALSGEIEQALRVAERAAEIARRRPSRQSQDVISTYANILLAKDPEASELILRGLLADRTVSALASDTRDTTELNLAMALVLRHYQLRGEAESDSNARLTEARKRLYRVFESSFQVGRYPLAGAAALMLGIANTLASEGTQVSWFAQAVAASARGAQMETLWRAHLNLASATYAADGTVEASVRDHARATLEILEDTLSPYPIPDRSARFALVRIPLAQAVRFLVLAGDDAGRAALERYPGLRPCFIDAGAGRLREDRGGYSSHEWLRIGCEDYVIY